MARIKATAARQNFFGIIRTTLRTRQPIYIDHREGEVVLLAEEDYEGLIETLELLSTKGLRESIAEAEEDIRKGRTVSIEEAFE